MKTYKFFRGMLKASVFTTVMFVMQACYGTPQQWEDPYIEEDEYEQVDNTIQDSIPDVPREIEAE